MIWAFIAGSLFTAAIVFVALWLGWSIRDRVGERLAEATVSFVPVPEPTLDEPITLSDYSAREFPVEDDE